MLNVDDKFNSAVKKMSLTGQWQFWSSLLKMSLTGQWQFLRQSHWELVKAENHWLIILVMDIPLMDKCHLPQSMTKIYGQNFKKKCHWPWSMTKKLSLTESDLSQCGCGGPHLESIQSCWRRKLWRRGDSSQSRCTSPRDSSKAFQE